MPNARQELFVWHLQISKKMRGNIFLTDWSCVRQQSRSLCSLHTKIFQFFVAVRSNWIFWSSQVGNVKMETFQIVYASVCMRMQLNLCYTGMLSDFCKNYGKDMNYSTLRPVPIPVKFLPLWTPIFAHRFIVLGSSLTVVVCRRKNDQFYNAGEGGLIWEIAHEIRDIGCQDKPRSHFGVFTACRLEWN